MKRDSCVACVPVRFARGYTPRLHLNVVVELPGNGKLHTGGGTRWYAILVEATGSPLCFTQVKVTGTSPVYFALVKITGRRISWGSIQGWRNG